MNKNIFRKIIIGTFISVPIISSFISTIHIVNFFNLGNESWLSYLLAIAFELGSIASFLTISLLKDIQKWMVWTIFFILSFLQIFGNVYYTFDYLNQMIVTQPDFLKSFNELISYFIGNDIRFNKIVLSLIIGVPIPLISLFFLKSTMDYLNVDDENKIYTNNNVQEIEKEQEEVIDENIIKENKMSETIDIQDDEETQAIIQNNL